MTEGQVEQENTPATRNECGLSKRLGMPGAARARAATGIRLSAIFTGSDAGIDITGETGAAERFRRLIGTMAVVVQPV
jgi:hypothetical protein